MLATFSLAVSTICTRPLNVSAMDVSSLRRHGDPWGGQTTTRDERGQPRQFRKGGNTGATLLSVDRELNSELTRRAGTSGICVGRRAEGCRDVVRVREIACVRA